MTWGKWKFHFYEEVRWMAPGVRPASSTHLAVLLCCLHCLFPFFFSLILFLSLFGCALWFENVKKNLLLSHMRVVFSVPASVSGSGWMLKMVSLNSSVERNRRFLKMMCKPELIPPQNIKLKLLFFQLRKKLSALISLECISSVQLFVPSFLWCSFNIFRSADCFRL